jgi:uncharacterized membrane protein YdjX (TVP38/TMEM64 family)
MTNKIRFLIFVVLLVAVWYAGKLFSVNTEAVEAFLKKFPLVLSGLIFSGLYVAVTLFVWPAKDIFKIVGAILFGAYASTLFIFIAEIINVFVLFYLARSLGRDFVEQSLKKSAKYGNLDEKLGGISFFWLFLFRFVPLVPFRFLDLACGLTKISFKRYLLAAILGSPVRIFWIQYVLSAVGKSIFTNPLVVSEYLLQNKTFMLFSLIYLLLIILVAGKIRERIR